MPRFVCFQKEWLTKSQGCPDYLFNLTFEPPSILRSCTRNLSNAHSQTLSCKHVWRLCRRGKRVDPCAPFTSADQMLPPGKGLSFLSSRAQYDIIIGHARAAVVWLGDATQPRASRPSLLRLRVQLNNREGSTGTKREGLVKFEYVVGTTPNLISSGSSDHVIFSILKPR